MLYFILALLQKINYFFNSLVLDNNNNNTAIE